MSADSRAPRRLVVRMPNWLGDAVMALPAVSALRDAYPDAHLAVAAIPSIAPMFEELTPVRQQQVLGVDKAHEADGLRAAGADTILLLPNSFRAAWVARRAAIPERWGYAAGVRGPLLTRGIGRPRGERHQSEYYAELVRGLGIPVEVSPPRIGVTAATATRAAAALESIDAAGSIVGFAPGAAYGHAKRWPPERVAEVVARLVRERQAACLLVGAPADREAGRAIESSLPPGVRVLNLIGRTDLRLLIGVLARCRAFVSNDSGAMHLAAAAGVPVTAIFGPTNERATAPLGEHDVLVEPVFCRPCMLRECPIDHRCMKRISSGAVYASVTRRL
jgi:heptosyltransferase-2